MANFEIKNPTYDNKAMTLMAKTVRFKVIINITV